MVCELVRNILQTFGTYVQDSSCYDWAFSMLCVLIPVLVIGTICLIVLCCVRGWFK